MANCFFCLVTSVCATVAPRDRWFLLAGLLIARAGLADYAHGKLVFIAGPPAADLQSQEKKALLSLKKKLKEKDDGFRL